MAPNEDLEARFAEAMARLFETGGMPRMAGRVWATLLVTDAAHMSSIELQAALGASAGSISQATRTLLQIGLIDAVAVRGERRDFFAVRPDAIAELVQLRMSRLVAMEQLAGDALEQFSDREHARDRLAELHEVYHFYVVEFPKLHQRFLAQRRKAAEREG